MRFPFKALKYEIDGQMREFDNEFFKEANEGVNYHMIDVNNDDGEDSS